MTRERNVTRKTLATYAAALGPDSEAARVLEAYDASRANGWRPRVTMTNHGFRMDATPGLARHTGPWVSPRD